MRIRNIITIFLTALLLGVSGLNAGYTPLNDLNLMEVASWASESSLPSTKYRYFAESENSLKKEVVWNSYKIEVAIISYAKIKDYSISKCRDNNEVSIYYIPEDVLNDSERFFKFQNVGENSNVVVWGAYDPFLVDPRRSMVMLTNPGGDNFELVQAHELSHYWYDFLCWERYKLPSHEGFAVDFENFYKTNYM